MIKINQVDKLLRELSKKHLEKIEELTVKQFEDALLGAIKSGDFIRCVEHCMPNSHHAQGVIYVPFAQKLSLQARIKELEGFKDMVYRWEDTVIELCKSIGDTIYECYRRDLE